MQPPYISQWAMGEGVEMVLVPTVFKSCGWFYTVPWYLASKELKIYVDLAVVCALVHTLSLGKGACCLCFVVAAADFFSEVEFGWSIGIFRRFILEVAFLIPTPGLVHCDMHSRPTHTSELAIVLHIALPLFSELHASCFFSLSAL